MIIVRSSRDRHWRVFWATDDEDGAAWIIRHRIPQRTGTRRAIYRAVLAAAAIDTPPGYPPLQMEG